MISLRKTGEIDLVVKVKRCTYVCIEVQSCIPQYVGPLNVYKKSAGQIM